MFTSSSMQVCGGDAVEKVDALFRANATPRVVAESGDLTGQSLQG